MKTVKVYQYRVKDPITGRRYLTRYRLAEEEAAERYPGGAFGGSDPVRQTTHAMFAMLAAQVAVLEPSPGDFSWRDMTQ